jgi:glycosyltransferase involved in cell wall biosynthesis
MPRIKTVYLTWGETPRSYGIYGSQVVGMLTNLAARHDLLKPHLLAGLPIVHSGLVRERWHYPAELTRVRLELGPVSLGICIIPVPQNFVYPRKRSFETIFAGAPFTLLPKLRQINPEVIHCRSFLASWIATDLRRRSDLKYRIIYDARSLWPEMQYRRRPIETDLEAFRARERELVAEVDGVVAVNEPMREHYLRMGALRVVTNYIAAPLVYSKEAESHNPDEPLRLVYAGALYQGGMQTPSMLFALAAAIRQLMGDVQLTVLTTSPHAPLKAQAEKILGSGFVTFKSITDPANMPYLLAKHHLACNVYKKPLTDIDQMLCATGFSTKSAEYLAAGLPVLVSQYPKAVGDLVVRNKVGIVFDETQKNFGLTYEKIKTMLNAQVRSRARVLASETFDRDVVSDRFADLYLELCQ